LVVLEAEIEKLKAAVDESRKVTDEAKAAVKTQKETLQVSILSIPISARKVFGQIYVVEPILRLLHLRLQSVCRYVLPWQ
jgi:hypothetical protein